MVRNTDDDYLDYCLTTAKHGFKIYDTIASTTHFNTSPFESWRSGFRESVKLTLQYEKTRNSEALDRLKVWCSIGEDSNYGNYAILGARVGVLYAIDNIKEQDKLKVINDFDSCKNIFVDPEYRYDDHNRAVLLIRLAKYNYHFMDFDAKQSAYLKSLFEYMT
jgi:hypothetical protein